MTQFVGAHPGGMAARRASLQSWRSHLHEQWRDAKPRTRTAIQMTALLAAVVCAYSYTLVTLLQNAGMQTPLAYVSLVPAIALALAAVRSHPMRAEPAIHDRQLDYIVGVPLIAAALAINLLLPQRLSAMFWVWRIDLLSLPLFVAGAVAIIFGVRVLWRQKLAIAYLWLAWPWPYSTVLLRVLDASTNATLAGIRAVLHVLPVAKPVLSGDGSLFVVSHHGTTFPLSVVSACSGINGIVGFLLVGVAFGAIVRGPFVKKLLWLASGMVLLWVINLVRLIFIFWAGSEWGEHVAIDILHPFLGLVTFCVGVMVMVLALGPLGMTIGPAPDKMAVPRTDRVANTVRARKNLAVPKVFGAIAIVTVAAVVLGIADLGLRSYDLVASASGEPKLLAFHSAPAVPDGWTIRPPARFDWAEPLFGDDSTWYRYTFISTGQGNLSAPFGVTADVINTSDLETFSAYGVVACYQFHGLNLQDVAEANLGGGITGQTLSFSGAGHGSWSVVYWIVPVKSGQSVRYERIVLYLLNAPGGAHVRLPAGIKITNVAGSLSGGGAQAELAANRTFLVAFAHELIEQQARRAAGESANVVTAASDGSASGGAVTTAARSAGGDSVGGTPVNPAVSLPKTQGLGSG